MAAAEPRFGKKLGTFEFDYMNRTSRQKVGALMTQYHGSMGDPYYAVGSYYIDNHTYPKLAVVEEALDQVESDIVKADAGASGWGKQEGKELRAIKRYLQWDIARMKGAAGHASGRFSPPTFQTVGYKNGYLHFKSEGNRTSIRAQAPNGEILGTFRSERAAKKAITDWAKRSRGRSSGMQIAEKDRRKVLLAIYKAVNVSDKMLRGGKHTIMLVGGPAERYGVSNYTNVVLEDASNADLHKLAMAYQLFKSQHAGRASGRRRPSIRAGMFVTFRNHGGAMQQGVVAGRADKKTFGAGAWNVDSYGTRWVLNKDDILSVSDKSQAAI